MLPKPPNGYLETDAAKTALHHYVRGGKFDLPTPLPKRANPSEVADFVDEALDAKELPPRHAGRLGQLIRFFDLRDTVTKLSKKINERDTSADAWLRILYLAAALADVGDAAHGAEAAGIVQRLSGRSYAAEHLESLIDVYLTLPQRTDRKVVAGAIEAEQKKVEPKRATDPEADRRYLELESLKTDRLVRVERARKRKFEILDIKDDRRRCEEVARVYLELQVFPTTSMKVWSVSRLQRECNSASPDVLAGVFSRLLDHLSSPAGLAGPTGGKLTDEDVPGVMTRCAHAIEFYLGKLTDAQLEFIEKKGGLRTQEDELWWEVEAPAPEEGAAAP